MKKTLISTSESLTESIAEKIGTTLQGGEVIELISDVGGGKTTFVRGLARGIGSTENVASPTFTISRVYTAKTLALHHFDFYRLQEAELIAYELEEVIGRDDCVVVVEWAQSVIHVLPSKRLKIGISKISDDEREFNIEAPRELLYTVDTL